jgi:hypothetical protein
LFASPERTSVKKLASPADRCSAWKIIQRLLPKQLMKLLSGWFRSWKRPGLISCLMARSKNGPVVADRRVVPQLSALPSSHPRHRQSLCQISDSKQALIVGFTGFNPARVLTSGCRTIRRSHPAPTANRQARHRLPGVNRCRLRPSIGVRTPLRRACKAMKEQQLAAIDP